MLRPSTDFWRTHVQLQYETEMEQRRHTSTTMEEPPSDRWPREELYQVELRTSSWYRQMINLWKLPYSRRACFTWVGRYEYWLQHLIRSRAGIPMMAQILCGVNAIALYSSVLFKDPHAGEINSKKAAWLGFGEIYSIATTIVC
jgi:hypothetical protein